MRSIRAFLFAEAAVFATAALIHVGLFTTAYRHVAAGFAETVIAATLAFGLVAGHVRPELARGLALAVQTLALVGVLIGMFAMAMGVGPRTFPDIVYHLAVACLVAIGLVATLRARGRLL